MSISIAAFDERNRHCAATLAVYRADVAKEVSRQISPGISALADWRGATMTIYFASNAADNRVS